MKGLRDSSGDQDVEVRGHAKQEADAVPAAAPLEKKTVFVRIQNRIEERLKSLGGIAPEQRCLILELLRELMSPYIRCALQTPIAHRKTEQGPFELIEARTLIMNEFAARLKLQQSIAVMHHQSIIDGVGEIFARYAEVNLSQDFYEEVPEGFNLRRNAIVDSAGEIEKGLREALSLEIQKSVFNSRAPLVKAKRELLLYFRRIDQGSRSGQREGLSDEGKADHGDLLIQLLSLVAATMQAKSSMSDCEFTIKIWSLYIKYYIGTEIFADLKYGMDKLTIIEAKARVIIELFASTVAECDDKVQALAHMEELHLKVKGQVNALNHELESKEQRLVQTRGDLAAVVKEKETLVARCEQLETELAESLQASEDLRSQLRASEITTSRLEQEPEILKSCPFEGTPEDVAKKDSYVQTIKRKYVTPYKANIFHLLIALYHCPNQYSACFVQGAQLISASNVGPACGKLAPSASKQEGSEDGDSRVEASHGYAAEGAVTQDAIPTFIAQLIFDLFRVSNNKARQCVTESSFYQWLLSTKLTAWKDEFKLALNLRASDVMDVSKDTRRIAGNLAKLYNSSSKLLPNEQVQFGERKIAAGDFFNTWKINSRPPEKDDELISYSSR